VGIAPGHAGGCTPVKQSSSQAVRGRRFCFIAGWAKGRARHSRPRVRLAARAPVQPAPTPRAFAALLAGHGPGAALQGRPGRQVSALIRELNELLAGSEGEGGDAGGSLAPEDVAKRLTEANRAVFDLLPAAIRGDLLRERDPHGNVQAGPRQPRAHAVLEDGWCGLAP